MSSNEFLLFFNAIVAVGMAFLALKIGKNSLTCYIASCGILANFFIFKQIDLFGLHVTATDVFIIAQLVALNLLQELYGAEEARKAININFFASICAVIFGLFHIAYTPNEFDSTHLIYVTLLNPIPRIVIASLSTDFFANHIERIVFSFLSKYFQKRFFALRNILTMIASQSFDTVVFSFAGLYGIVASIPHIMITSLSIKIILIITMSFLSSGAYSYIQSK